MPFEPDPTPRSLIPVAGDPDRMGPWRPFPVAWNPEPFSSPMFPVTGKPMGFWMRRGSVDFNPGWGRSDPDRGYAAQ